MIHTVRLILGDQLNPNHSWFDHSDDGVLYLMAELMQETDYCRHHIQKLCAFFAAMAEFADAIESKGHQVQLLTLDDTQEYQDLPALIDATVIRCGATKFEYQRPDEYRLLMQLRNMTLPVPTLEHDSEHFLLPFAEITEQFQAGKKQRMEHFYRRMRRRFGVLMDGDSPEGGRWNFDKDNRNALPQSQWQNIPEPLLFSNDVSAITQRLQRHNVASIGHLEGQLLWPINRPQAKALLSYFCQHLLAHFGTYQDAMSAEAPHKWSLYHARLSFALNSKMLSPIEVIQQALQAFDGNHQTGIAQVEGFVRQILGWREYVRGIYWANMPQYANCNHFQATAALPSWYWHGNTNMRCLQQSIQQSLQYAYAHHIQRLMVTGTFALLIGADPDEVDHWYLGIYIDAVEWVEMPNTRGMSQFADGGLLASKPYAASGKYLNRMSDYCQHCRYQVTQTTGRHACPWNSLYWRFIDKHAIELARNPRTRMVLRHWDNRSPAQRQSILDQAQQHLDNIEHL